MEIVRTEHTYIKETYVLKKLKELKMEIVRTEHTYIKETYVSIDKRIFDCEDECIEYEKWLETNSRNIPTKEQFDALKEGEQVLCGGRLFRLDSISK